MNTIDYTQTGGFPLDQNVLGFMQAQSQLAQQPANFGGQLCVISGCVVTGASVSNGFVAINGEVLPFNGGTISPKVIIVETSTVLMYEDGSAKPVQKTRYATFGDDGVQNNLWVNFKRNTPEGVLARLERLERMAAPILTGEGWVLFCKPAIAIPPFWVEVIEMRGRMAVHEDLSQAEFAGIGRNLGAKQHVLTESHLPQIDLNRAGVGLVRKNGTSTPGSADDSPDEINIIDTAQIPVFGGNQPVNHMNPYRIVLYIKYVGN